MRVLLLIITAALVLPLFQPQPARAGDTEEIVVGTVVAGALVWYLLQDDEPGASEHLQTIAGFLAPRVIDELDEFLATDNAREVLGSGGVPLAQAALNYYAPRLTNWTSEMQDGDGPVLAAYEWLKEQDPDSAAMLYRTGSQGEPQGLWPRLEAWLADKGYLSRLSLLERVNRDLVGVVLELKPDDRRELIRRGIVAIVEEYEAVMEDEQGAAEPVAAVDESWWE